MYLHRQKGERQGKLSVHGDKNTANSDVDSARCEGHGDKVTSKDLQSSTSLRNGLRKNVSCVKEGPKHAHLASRPATRKTLSYASGENDESESCYEPGGNDCNTNSVNKTLVINVQGVTEEIGSNVLDQLVDLNVLSIDTGQLPPRTQRLLAQMVRFPQNELRALALSYFQVNNFDLDCLQILLRMDRKNNLFKKYLDTPFPILGKSLVQKLCLFLIVVRFDVELGRYFMEELLKKKEEAPKRDRTVTPDSHGRLSAGIKSMLVAAFSTNPFPTGDEYDLITCRIWQKGYEITRKQVMLWFRKKRIQVRHNGRIHNVSGTSPAIRAFVCDLSEQVINVWRKHYHNMSLEADITLKSLGFNHKMKVHFKHRDEVDPPSHLQTGEVITQTKAATVNTIKNSRRKRTQDNTQSDGEGSETASELHSSCQNGVRGVSENVLPVDPQGTHLRSTDGHQSTSEIHERSSENNTGALENHTGASQSPGLSSKCKAGPSENHQRSCKSQERSSESQMNTTLVDSSSNSQKSADSYGSQHTVCPPSTMGNNVPNSATQFSPLDTQNNIRSPVPENDKQCSTGVNDMVLTDLKEESEKNVAKPGTCKSEFGHSLEKSTTDGRLELSENAEGGNLPLSSVAPPASQDIPESAAGNPTNAQQPVRKKKHKGDTKPSKGDTKPSKGDTKPSKGRSHQCSHCPKSYKYASSLKYHQSAVHENVKPHICPSCGKTYGTSFQLQNHERKSHGMEGPLGFRGYQCNLCDKSFHGMHNLRSHMMVHSDLRSFQCDICQRGFKARHKLTAHLKIHSDRRDYECDICLKRFKQVETLHSHKKTHSEQVHDCKICSKKFTSMSGLNDHQVVHEPKRAFKCQHCDKTYLYRTNLRRHTYSAHGGEERKYKCEECDKSFSLKDYYTLHRRGVHGEGKPPPSFLKRQKERKLKTKTPRKSRAKSKELCKLQPLQYDTYIDVETVEPSETQCQPVSFNSAALKETSGQTADKRLASQSNASSTGIAVSSARLAVSSAGVSVSSAGLNVSSTGLVPSQHVLPRFTLAPTHPGPHARLGVQPTPGPMGYSFVPALPSYSTVSGMTPLMGTTTSGLPTVILPQSSLVNAANDPGKMTILIQPSPYMHIGHPAVAYPPIGAPAQVSSQSLPPQCAEADGGLSCRLLAPPGDLRETINYSQPPSSTSAKCSVPSSITEGREADDKLRGQPPLFDPLNSQVGIKTEDCKPDVDSLDNAYSSMESTYEDQTICISNSVDTDGMKEEENDEKHLEAFSVNLSQNVMTSEDKVGMACGTLSSRFLDRSNERFLVNMAGDGGGGHPIPPLVITPSRDTQSPLAISTPKWAVVRHDS